MLLLVEENTFDFIRIDGSSDNQIMKFRFRRLKKDGYVNDLDKLTGIECINSFKVAFSKYDWYISTFGESFMITIDVPYSELIFEYVNCNHINTRLSETKGHPSVFNQFINNPNVECLTYDQDLAKSLKFNDINYIPTYKKTREALEIELEDTEFSVDLNQYDLSDIGEIIIVHMHTTQLNVIGLPERFIESDKYDQELAFSLRNTLRGSERVQFRVGLVGDDPCITKYVSKEWLINETNS